MKRAVPLLFLLLAGCSQVDALAPVGGDDVSKVRFAANDILVGAGVDLMTAPVCTNHDGIASCAGTTMTGDDIAVRCEGDHLTVTVGQHSLYDGSLAQIIAENAQPQ